MKRNLIAMILILSLVITACATAEGLLPSLTDTIGKPMPSLGEALVRYPDNEIPNDDGSNTEVFQGVTETDFNTFSVYLSEQGATLADYQIVGSSFSASILVDGKTISFTYDAQTLEATVTYPEGTYDEWLDYAKSQYKAAIQLQNAGKIDEALAVIVSIPGYSGFKPVTENPELIAAAYKTVGAYVTFGHYPQTINGNDCTPIEWLVLDYDEANHCSLIISRYGLDVQPYNTTKEPTTWEKCTLRSWLNNDFMDKAFSDTEQMAILTTAVDNSESQGLRNWDTNGENDTKDKIFLLSYTEANTYFGVTQKDRMNMKSRVAPTTYALQAKAWTSDINITEDGAKAGWWWLRSPGSNQFSAAYVSNDGSLSLIDVNNVSGCVRPALWINLDSDIF